MLRGLEIICEQYDFTGLTDDINEVNFYSGLEPDLLATIDLSDYIEARSSVVFKKLREEIDRFQDSLKLYGVMNDLKLELSNLVKPKLFDFFALDNNDSNSFLAYKILIKDEGELISQGILKPNDIVYKQPLEPNDRDIIQVTIYEWGKEFKNYYSQGEMPDLSTPHNYWINQTFNGSTVEYITLTSLVEGLFGIGDMEMMTDQGIDGNTSLRSWRMTRLPNMINPQFSTDSLFWFQNGYDYIRENQKLSPFEFFKKLCNGMGWVFYFKIIDNELKFVVRNRKTNKNFFKRRTIDNRDIIEYDAEYKLYRQKIKCIKIPVMEIGGGEKIFYSRNNGNNINNTNFVVETDVMHGTYDLVFSKEKTPPRNDLIYFQNAIIRTGDNIFIRPIANNDYGYSKFYSQNDETARWENIFVNYDDEGSVSFIERFEFNFEVKFLLEIDGGANNFQVDKKRRKDLSNNVATDYRSGDNISDEDLIYTGNICTAMIRRDSDGWTQYLALNNEVAGNRSYTRSEQLKANIEGLLTDNSNLIIPVKVRGFYTDLDEIIDFTNPNMEFPWGYEYDVISLEADKINNETLYYLQRRYIE